MSIYKKKILVFDTKHSHIYSIKQKLELTVYLKAIYFSIFVDFQIFMSLNFLKQKIQIKT